MRDDGSGSSATSSAQRWPLEEEGFEEQSFRYHFRRERSQRLRHWVSQAEEEEEKGSPKATARGSQAQTQRGTQKSITPSIFLPIRTPSHWFRYLYSVIKWFRYLSHIIV